MTQHFIYNETIKSKDLFSILIHRFLRFLRNFGRCSADWCRPVPVEPNTLARIDLKTNKSENIRSFIMKPFTLNKGTGK